MAGHSRWAKVKHFKGGLEARRGRTFSKLIEALEGHDGVKEVYSNAELQEQAAVR